MHNDNEVKEHKGGKTLITITTWITNYLTNLVEIHTCEVVHHTKKSGRKPKKRRNTTDNHENAGTHHSKVQLYWQRRLPSFMCTNHIWCVFVVIVGSGGEWSSSGERSSDTPRMQRSSDTRVGERKHGSRVGKPNATRYINICELFLWRMVVRDTRNMVLYCMAKKRNVKFL
jgi:hypothetical protein